MTRTTLTALVLAVLLAGCRSDADTALAPAQPITDGDSCHVCGMLIAELPGPKGQVYLNRDETVRKFCSTADMFAFLLQPENANRLSHAWVHDVAVTPWSQPADKAFILASDAWYVAGHTQRGAMGHTLASFKERHHADAFRETHGGEVLAFSDIDLELLTELARADAGMQHNGGMPGHGEHDSAMHGHAAHGSMHNSH
ncbi:nitrous oxide reductase accessory protein NosL [Halomonas sp. A29]|uniref:nitrous oxide reductase accessory protein NosL n=1 Tax=Halomonas sp. A29 TaxID=3102786 RepID=UPI00398B8F17